MGAKRQKHSYYYTQESWFQNSLEILLAVSYNDTLSQDLNTDCNTSGQIALQDCGLS